MQRLTQAPNITMATIWVDVLREAGIKATVERQYLGSAAGMLPPGECFPEVWLQYPEQLERAQALLQDLQNLPQRQWWCRCGESVEGGFEQCWCCGAWMP